MADVGCGHGASLVAMAAAYPNSKFVGFDFHGPSIETCRKRTSEAGLGGRAHFEVATATSYSGEFDLICFFDCLHDMGDPVGAARHARERLLPGGTVLLVEPFALDERPRNIAENPMAALFYVASTCVCTPNSLSQEVGLALGAQAGEAKLREVFKQAGFNHFSARPRRRQTSSLKLEYDTAFRNDADDFQRTGHSIISVVFACIGGYLAHAFASSLNPEETAAGS